MQTEGVSRYQRLGTRRISCKASRQSAKSLLAETNKKRGALGQDIRFIQISEESYKAPLLTFFISKTQFLNRNRMDQHVKNLEIEFWNDKNQRRK
jgi:hypothetical protein